MVDSDTSGKLIDRQRIIVKALLENTLGSSVKLAPVTTVTRDGVRTVQGAVDGAIVEMLRDSGYQSVRVQELATPQEEAAAAQEVADRVGQMIQRIDEAVAGGTTPESKAPPESVEGQIRVAFPTEPDESVRAMMIHLDLMADASGLTTEQLLTQRYADQRPVGRVGELIDMAPPPDNVEGVPFVGGRFALPPTRQQALRGFDFDRPPSPMPPTPPQQYEFGERPNRYDTIVPPTPPEPTTTPAPPTPPTQEPGVTPPPPPAVPPVTEPPRSPPPPAPTAPEIPMTERRRSRELINVNPAVLKVDASRFQFKGEIDEAAIEQRWQGVDEWDPLGSGVIVVWQDSLIPPAPARTSSLAAAARPVSTTLGGGSG